MGEDYAAQISSHSTLVSQLLDEWSATESRTLHQLKECSEEWIHDLEEVDREYYAKASQTRDNLTDQVQVRATLQIRLPLPRPCCHL